MLMHFGVSLVLASSTVIPLAACGDNVASSAPLATVDAASALPAARRVASDEPAISASLQRALCVAFGLPRVVAADVVVSRGMLVEAVYFATATTGAAQLGQITSTGTITVGTSNPTYERTPSDRLVVIFDKAKQGKETHEFVVLEAQGNSQADSATSWLASPHVLRYTHKIPGSAEAEITSKFDGVRFEAKVKGFLKIGEQRYDLAMAAAGTAQGTRDLDGHDTETKYELTGTIKADGFDVAVNEHHVLTSAGSYSLRLLTTQRGTASQLRAQIANTLKHDGATYSFSNVEVDSGSTDKGNQQKSGITLARGSILREQQPFAECRLLDGAVLATVGEQTFRLDDLAPR